MLRGDPFDFEGWFYFWFWHDYSLVDFALNFLFQDFLIFWNKDYVQEFSVSRRENGKAKEINR